MDSMLSGSTDLHTGLINTRKGFTFNNWAQICFGCAWNFRKRTYLLRGHTILKQYQFNVGSMSRQINIESTLFQCCVPAWLENVQIFRVNRAQALAKGPWLQMYMVPGNCMPLGLLTTKGSPSWTWQAGGGSFLLLPRRHALSSWWLWTFNYNMCENHLEGTANSSPFPPPLSRQAATCTAFVRWVQCSMPIRLGHW